MHAHTHAQLPFSKSVLNMFVSLSSPTLDMCKNILAAELPPPATSHMLPSWPARAPGFLGENQMTGVEIPCFFTWHFICQNLWLFCPLDMHLSSSPPSRGLGFLRFVHCMPSLMPRDALLWVTTHVQASLGL